MSASAIQLNAFDKTEMLLVESKHVYNTLVSNKIRSGYSWIISRR